MTRLSEHLIRLANALAAHEGVTHWAISSRVSTKGDQFHRLMKGGGCTTATYERLLSRLSAIWPADLEWPADIERPEATERDDAA